MEGKSLARLREARGGIMFVLSNSSTAGGSDLSCLNTDLGPPRNT